MSVKDFIKKSVLEGVSPYNVPQMAGALLAALAMGVLIYWVYQRFYAGVIFSRSFAMTLVGMSVLTCMVTLAISSNVVISLGMVGALSIVRFRTAVKDPLDLLYLFWSITAGITTGAGMYLLAVAASAVMIGVVVFLSRWQTAGRSYVAVLHYQGEKPATRSSGRWGGTSSPSNPRPSGPRAPSWPWRSAAGTTPVRSPTGCAALRAWRT